MFISHNPEKPNKQNTRKEEKRTKKKKKKSVIAIQCHVLANVKTLNGVYGRDQCTRQCLYTVNKKAPKTHDAKWQFPVSQDAAASHDVSFPALGSSYCLRRPPCVESKMLTQAIIALASMPINAVDLPVKFLSQEPFEDSCEYLTHSHPCHVL